MELFGPTLLSNFPLKKSDFLGIFKNILTGFYCACFVEALLVHFCLFVATLFGLWFIAVFKFSTILDTMLHQFYPSRSMKKNTVTILPSLCLLNGRANVKNRHI
jgi:hypothetical protein